MTHLQNGRMKIAEQEEDLSEKDVEKENNLRREKKWEMDHEY